MAATQLQIYNDALLLCEERFLAGSNGIPTESRKPKHLLDQVWDNGGIKACLEEGLWTFAARTVSPTADPSIQPPFGFQNAFKQPPDFVRTIGMASDPYFQSAFTEYADESGYWWADINPIFVKYVSSDPSYGLNLDLWPESFKSFVSAHFASCVVKALTHNKEIQDRVEAARKKNLESARGKDGMNEPAKFSPRGQLSRARRGMYSGRPNYTGSGWY